MANTVKLYYHPVSQPSRSVSIFGEAAGIPLERHVLDLFKGEHKAEAYLKINPHGKVPAIVDGDFHLTEGAAILVYLANSHGKAEWYPQDPKAQARVNEWLHWAHTGIRKVSTYQLLVPVLIFKKSADELGPQKEELKGVLSFIDSSLGKSRYLAGETPTIADLFVIPEVDQVQIFGFNDLSAYPNITRWIADLKEHVKGYAESAATVVAIAAQASQPKLSTTSPRL